MFGRDKSQTSAQRQAPASVSSSGDDAELKARLETAAATATPGAQTQTDICGAIEPGRPAKAAILSGEISQAVGAIVRVLMQTGHGKHFSLSDLEWLVLPAIASRQYRLGEMVSENGEAVFPAGVIIWASVSQDVDRRLSEILNSPVRLRPGEWTSGNIVWLIEASGHPKIVHNLLNQLAQSLGADRQLKMRKKGPDGKMTIGAWP